MGKDYLVDGAQLTCVNGTGVSRLTVKKSHGVDEKGRKKANCTDSKAKENIPYFKSCKLNKDTHLCEGYMKLAKKWENTVGMSSQMEKVDGQNAITLDSVLLCRRGGLILPITSGQQERQGIDRSAFRKRYQRAAAWAIGKNPGFQIEKWDPINMNTGNFTYEKEDLIIPGITRLSFQIFYNSMDEEGNSLGKGWHHNHEIYIKKEENGKLCLCRGDGKEIPYRPVSGGLYAPVLGDKGLLAETKEGFRYAGSDRNEYTFDKNGQLLSHKDQNGNTDTYTYNDKGRLSSVKGANGGELFFNYNKEGYLIRVKDHTEREVQIWYKYGKLWKFINASGYTYTYAYNENGKLESVLTPRGITGVKNEYDARGRVLKQTMPDGSIVELKYDDADMRTYLKEPNGNLISYDSDDKCRNIRAGYEDGEESWEYNDQNLRTLYVDKNGNKTRYRYDDKGNLTGTTNALGEKAEFTYDREGRMLTASQGGKKLLGNTYDEKGRLIETSDALLRSRKTAYDEKGLPVLLTWPDGSSFQIIRDERGNVIKITDPYGGETCYTYDDLNRVEAATDAEGNITHYQYDAGNHLLKVTNPEGNTRAYAYNESGKPVQMEDFDGGVLSIAYNAMGKPEKLTDKEGRETKRTYNEMGKLQEEIAPCGAATGFTYDKTGHLTRMEIRKGAGEEEAASVASYAYDPAGNLLKIQAGDGKEVLSETSYAYDALNRVSEITDPAGGKTLYAYDRAGHVSSITDPAGNRRTFVYNDAGELVEETDIRGNTIRYEYNLLGQLSSVTDGAGRKTRHFYLHGGRLEKTVYPDGRQMNFTYDKLGRIISKTDGQGYTLFYAYDCMGRVLSVQSSAGQKKTYTYDASGNVASMTDANGNTTKYEYTLSGRLKGVTDALGNRAEYAYDNEDRLIHICQKGKGGEENRETFYERNPLGQVECIRDAFGNEERYSYDALGRTIIKTDRDGYRTEYDYTGDGKIKNISYGDGTSVEMEYTALRQLALIKDWLGETRIRRDTAGRITDITDHKGRTVAYEWGSMNERRSITYPDGNKAIYVYDEMLRLKEMQTGKCGEIHYKYDDMGRISEKLFPEGMRTRWLYDERGQLQELVHEDDCGILDRYQYEYDFMGNKTAIVKERRGLKEESGRYEYGYDALSRLISVSKDGDDLRSYTYDSFGNRSCLTDFKKGRETSYYYDALNRLISMEAGERKNVLRTDYTYDNRGNLIGEEAEGRLIHGYEYGAMNRLSKSWNDKGQEAVYLYNGLGQRTGKSINGEEEDYLLDLTRGYHNLLEIQKEGKGQRFYFDGNVAAMEETGGRRIAGGRNAGERVRPAYGATENRRTAFSGLHYYMQDELGSPLRVSGYRKKEGSFIGRSEYLTYGYDEFGNDLGIDLRRELDEAGIPNPYDRQGAEQPFGYTGYRYDDISGTYFAQAREYQPENGRFTAEDVIKGNRMIPETINQYGYCINNALIYVDFDGRVVYYFYDPDTFSSENFEKEIEDDINQLGELYNTEVRPKALESTSDFETEWNKMDDVSETIDAVVIFSHAGANKITTSSHFEKKFLFWGEKWIQDETMDQNTVINLDDKQINTVILLGCNTGLTEQDEGNVSAGKRENIATEFSKKVGVGRVIAVDGSISHTFENDQHAMEVVMSHNSDYHTDGTFDGFKVYYHNDEKNPKYIGMKFANIVELVNKADLEGDENDK